MSKKLKKRNKPYTGKDAVLDKPILHHYTAVSRSPLSEWWQDHKRTVRISTAIGGGIVVFGYLIFEFLHMIF